MVRIQRRSFPRDPWTAATANGLLARSPIGRNPCRARWLERVVRGGRVTAAVSGVRLARLVFLGRPGGRICLVATSGPDVVGYGCLQATADVDETHERRGGKAGCSQLTLHVRPDNGTARRVYERAGFEAEGVIRRYYQPSGTDALFRRLGIPCGSTAPDSLSGADGGRGGEAGRHRHIEKRPPPGGRR